MTIRSDFRPCSLSGVARCAACGGTVRTCRSRDSRVRLECANRIKNGTCSQPSAYLDIFEAQLLDYLRAFHIPEDYQEKILEAHLKIASAYHEVEQQRAKLRDRLERIKDLYELGHKSRQEYLADYAAIQRELEALPDATADSEELEKLASFLEDITLAWEDATQEQRHRLASHLFEAVWIKDKQLLAVTPRPDFRPFFDLQYAGAPEAVMHIAHRRGFNPL